VFCHVPSRRFIESGLALIGKFAKHSAKFRSDVDRYGNVSTCTLPFAMSEAKEAGALAPGSKVLVLAPSSGISAAAVTMVW
jgi:3-oxoacyl-[acyl-carrier-protein] synthase-3